MKDLDKKLKIIEQETIDEKIRKKALRAKAQNKESKIHLEFINIWEKEVLSNKQFISDLDKILKTFKKIRPKNNRYSWKFFEGNISIKEKVKDEVAFYLNDQMNNKYAAHVNFLFNTIEPEFSIIYKIVSH